MISEIHGADVHAPFPHKIVTGTGRAPLRRDKHGKVIEWEEYEYSYLVCAICRHYVSTEGTNGRTSKQCKCRASCHDTFVVAS